MSTPDSNRGKLPLGERRNPTVPELDPLPSSALLGDPAAWHRPSSESPEALYLASTGRWPCDCPAVCTCVTAPAPDAPAPVKPPKKAPRRRRGDDREARVDADLAMAAELSGRLKQVLDEIAVELANPPKEKPRARP
jgi:hypothetical protein